MGRTGTLRTLLVALAIAASLMLGAMAPGLAVASSAAPVLPPATLGNPSPVVITPPVMDLIAGLTGTCSSGVTGCGNTTDLSDTTRATGPERGFTTIFDLGAPQTSASGRLYARNLEPDSNGWCTAGSDRTEVAHSADGITWTSVTGLVRVDGRYAMPAGPCIANGYLGSGEQTFTFTPTTARYWKLLGATNACSCSSAIYSWSLYQSGASAPPVAPTPVAPSPTVSTEQRIADFWKRMDALAPTDNVSAGDLGGWALNVIDRNPRARLTVADFRAATARMQAGLDRAGLGPVPVATPTPAPDMEARIAAFWARIGALQPGEYVSAADLGQWALNVIGRIPRAQLSALDFRVSTAYMQLGLDRAGLAP